MERLEKIGEVGQCETIARNNKKEARSHGAKPRMRRIYSCEVQSQKKQRMLEIYKHMGQRTVEFC